MFKVIKNYMKIFVKQYYIILLKKKLSRNNNFTKKFYGKYKCILKIKTFKYEEKIFYLPESTNSFSKAQIFNKKISKYYSFRKINII